MMDTLRTALWFSLAALLVFLMNAWHQDYSTIPSKKAHLEKVVQIPQVEAPIVQENLIEPIPSWRQITFETDVFKGVIDKEGGDLVYLELIKHADSLDAKGKPRNHFVLLDHSAKRYYVAQTDLVKVHTDLHTQQRPLYESNQGHYALKENEKTLSIDLSREENGAKVTKRYTFARGNYQVGVKYHLNNQGQNIWKGQPYAQLRQKITKGGWFSSSSYKGAISSDKKPYEKFTLDKIPQSLPKSTQKAWFAFVEPYFASAWISKLPLVSYYSHQDKNFAVLGMLGNLWEVAPGNSQESNLTLYVGPKEINGLKEAASSLDLLVDYGLSWFIAKKVLWLLEIFYTWIGNWGWAIVGVTILSKLCLYPLSAKSTRSMIAMQRVQPQVDALKARYSHDPLKRFQAESDLYRREKISRSAGLFASLLQLPIFMAINAVLVESIELRHQPFILWIKDLTAPDPYYLLPVLSALLMGLMFKTGPQMNQTSATNNEVQFMVPIILGIVFSNFPAGFTLYFALQSGVSMLEKWWLSGARLPKFFSLPFKQ